MAAAAAAGFECRDPNALGDDTFGDDDGGEGGQGGYAYLLLAPSTCNRTLTELTARIEGECAGRQSQCDSSPGGVCRSCVTAYDTVAGHGRFGALTPTELYDASNRSQCTSTATAQLVGSVQRCLGNGSSAETGSGNLATRCVQLVWRCQANATCGGCVAGPHGDDGLLAYNARAAGQLASGRPSPADWFNLLASAECATAVRASPAQLSSLPSAVGSAAHLGTGGTDAVEGTAETSYPEWTLFGPAVAYCGADFTQHFRCQFEAIKCGQDPTCSTCLAGDPTGSGVVIRYTSACAIPIRGVVSACGNSSFLSYTACSENVSINNRIVAATQWFGGVSLAGCLCVFAVIFAYRKDQRSLRERILVGVFAGNTIYSLVNLVPISAEHVDSYNCGDPVIASPQSQAWVRGLWFWGKYTMVGYELFVVFASVVALRTGSINMRRVHERAAHGCCTRVTPDLILGAFFSLGSPAPARAVRCSPEPCMVPAPCRMLTCACVPIRSSDRPVVWHAWPIHRTARLL